MKAFARVAAAVWGVAAVGMALLGLVPFSAPAGVGRVGRGAVMIRLFVLVLPFALAVGVFSVVKLFQPLDR